MNYSHLTLDERREIFILKEQNIGIRGIARALNRHASTISRELKRNVIINEDDPSQYSYLPAHEIYLNRIRVQKGGKYQNQILTQYITDNLLKRWSPEQISGRLELDYSDDPSMSVSFASIYRWIKLNRLAINAKSVLRRRGRGKAKKIKIKRFPGAKSVKIRPVEASDRNRLGDWEMDSVVSGKRDMSGILTMYDRMSRYCIIRFMKNSKSGWFTLRTIEDVSGRFPFHTATSDQGVEFSYHKEIEERVGLQFYICDPHSPWQKGGVEHLNGLIRDFFPKGTNFRDIDEKDIIRVMELLNNRPRKCLNWKTPTEIFLAETGED